MSDAVPFSRVTISPVAYLGEAWSRVKGRYGLFFGVTALGMLLGGMAPLGLLLGPMMCGIYFCYREQALGRPLSFDMLFRGFQHFAESFIATLLMLAASLVVMLPALVLMVILIFSGVAGGLFMHSPEAQAGATAAGCLLFGVFFLAVLLASALIGVFFIFAYPLILDRGLSGLEAVKLSFRAARANLGGLLLLALANLALSFLGLLCCYVGAFLILPITLGAQWICYERVFGIQEAGAAPAP